jgi:hypothetical protein
MDLEVEDMPADLQQDNVQALQTEAEVRVKTAKRYEPEMAICNHFGGAK